MKCDLCGADDNIDNVVVLERDFTFGACYLGCNRCAQELAFHISQSEAGRIWSRVSHEIEMLDVLRNFNKSEYMNLVDLRHKAHDAVVQEYLKHCDAIRSRNGISGSGYDDEE